MAWYGKGLATQFCLVFPDEWIGALRTYYHYEPDSANNYHPLALETVGVWYTADIINDLDRAALAGVGAIAAITPHPTQWQSEELPDEVDVKDRLKPFYLRIVRSRRRSRRGRMSWAFGWAPGAARRACGPISTRAMVQIAGLAVDQARYSGCG